MLRMRGLFVFLYLLAASAVTGLSVRLPWAARAPERTTRVAVLGGGFAGLTAARTLAKDRRVEVLLVDQRSYFEYTPGILRAWVNPGVHKALVNPIARLLRSKRAKFQRVPPGCAAQLTETSREEGARPLRFTVSSGEEQHVAWECDYVVLATGGEQAPLSDDRKLSDGTIVARRARLHEQGESEPRVRARALPLAAVSALFVSCRGCSVCPWLPFGCPQIRSQGVRCANSCCNRHRTACTAALHLACLHLACRGPCHADGSDGTASPKP